MLAPQVDTKVSLRGPCQPIHRPPDARDLGKVARAEAALRQGQDRVMISLSGAHPGLTMVGCSFRCSSCSIDDVTRGPVPTSSRGCGRATELNRVHARALKRRSGWRRSFVVCGVRWPTRSLGWRCRPVVAARVITPCPRGAGQADTAVGERPSASSALKRWRPFASGEHEPVTGSRRRVTMLGASFGDRGAVPSRQKTDRASVFATSASSFVTS